MMIVQMASTPIRQVRNSAAASTPSAITMQSPPRPPTIPTTWMPTGDSSGQRACTRPETTTSPIRAR